MTERILRFLVHFVTHVIGSLGYAGIVALMGIESACIPLPSEIIMPFAGYLVYTGRFSLFWAATAGAIGCNLGSVVAYWIGAWGGRPLVERYGRWVLMSRHDLDRMTRSLRNTAASPFCSAVCFRWCAPSSRFRPASRRMPQLRFHIYTFIGSWPWCFALAYVGMRLGEAWHTDPRFHEWFHRFHLVVELGLVAAIVWFVWTHINRVRQARRSLT